MDFTRRASTDKHNGAAAQADEKTAARETPRTGKDGAAPEAARRGGALCLIYAYLWNIRVKSRRMQKAGKTLIAHTIGFAAYRHIKASLLPIFCAAEESRRRTHQLIYNITA